MDFKIGFFKGITASPLGGCGNYDTHKGMMPNDKWGPLMVHPDSNSPLEKSDEYIEFTVNSITDIVPKCICIKNKYDYSEDEIVEEAKRVLMDYINENTDLLMQLS